MNSDKPITLEEIQRDLDRLGGIGYAEDDIKALLNHSGEQMLGYLIDKMSNQYRKSFTNSWCVPSSLLWESTTLKAYDELIPICESWLEELKQKRDQLKIKVLHLSST